jgi:hypothetical protein
LSARDPAHSEIRKPTEMIPIRSPRTTSSTRGRTTLSTAGWVRKVPDLVMIQPLISSTTSGPSRPRRCPTLEIRPRTSGGRESSAQKAASAARPVIR